MRFCPNCNEDVEGIFCPECKSLTVLENPHSRPEPISKSGDRFDCAVWEGGQDKILGLRFGFPNRDKYFSKRENTIILHLDSVRCIAEFTDGFWNKCPEIRVAKDADGKNRLADWLRKHNLLPPGEARKLRGRPDAIIVEVIIPENEFKAYVKGSKGRPV